MRGTELKEHFFFFFKSSQWRFSITNIFSDLGFVWMAISIYIFTPYYQFFLYFPAKITLIIIALMFSVYTVTYHLITPRPSLSRSATLAISFYKQASWILTTLICLLSKKQTPSRDPFTQEAKTTLLFYIVKFFFIPLMTKFCVGHIVVFFEKIDTISLWTFFSARGFLSQGLPFVLNLIFFVDTFVFVIGYLLESEKLDNTVRSVEGTVVGWLVALICYPPFTPLFAHLVPGLSHINPISILEQNPTFTYCILGVIVIVLYSFYLATTLSLGFHSSNLTNRGIVTKGTFAIIRHPHYVSKNLVWWLLGFVSFSPVVFMSCAFWSTIYYLRAMTEERHLLQDPEYQAYTKKVPYRFIPYVL